MFKIQDIMTKGAVCVRKDTPVSEAIEVLINNGITGVPVVDGDMDLVGILTEQDVLRLFHTHKEEGSRTAGEFMTRPAIHFEENESLLDICFRLRDTAIRRVPVTSEGKVTGIISRADILKCILQMLREPCHADS